MEEKKKHMLGTIPSIQLSAFLLGQLKELMVKAFILYNYDLHKLHSVFKKINYSFIWLHGVLVAACGV